MGILVLLSFEQTYRLAEGVLAQMLVLVLVVQAAHRAVLVRVTANAHHEHQPIVDHHCLAK